MERQLIEQVLTAWRARNRINRMQLRADFQKSGKVDVGRGPISRSSMNHSLSAVGWSIIALSVFLIVWELLGLLTSTSAEDLAVLMNSGPSAGSEPLAAVVSQVRYNRIWSVYAIVYSLFVLAGGIQLVRRRPAGRTILEIVCWVGILNACIDSTISILLWNKMEAALTRTVGPMSVQLLSWNPLGLVVIVVGFFVWVIPAAGILIYLRKLKSPARPVEPDVYVERKPRT